MNIYSVDKIKETLIKSNPLWQKPIKVSGTYQEEIRERFIVSEETGSRIRIDDEFYPEVSGIEDGDVITLEGYLNYVCWGQIFKGSDENKIRSINFTKSYLAFVFYPTGVKEVNNKQSEETGKISFKEDKPDKVSLESMFESGCFSKGCLGILAVVAVLFILYLLLF